MQQTGRAKLIGGDVIEKIMVEVPGGMIAENSSDNDGGVLRRAELQLVGHGSAE